MKITTQNAIGLYSDSSLSCVDASLINTDGVDIFHLGKSIIHPYPQDLKDRLKQLTPDDIANADLIKLLEEQITQQHILAVKKLKEHIGPHCPDIDIIGFPGHTILHQPAHHVHIKLGNAKEMAQAFSCPVVSSFTKADIRAGGTGGPLFPTFIDALTRTIPKPLAFVFLGGTTSLIYISPEGQYLAFEVGCGNLLLDKWIKRKTNQDMDYDGEIASKGVLNEKALDALKRFDFLQKAPPKTVNKDDFEGLLEQVEGLNTPDGALLLTTFIADTISDSSRFFPAPVQGWIFTGGGCQNPVLLRLIKQKIKQPVLLASDFGWDKNTLESLGYGFLAVRSLFGLPLTFPTTTGISTELAGGELTTPT